MSVGNPQFNPKLNLPNASEKFKSGQEILWEQKRKEIDEVVDEKGKGVDEGIKETVVAFNVYGISTSASCEGHQEVRGGHRPWPWVEVSSPDEPEERFIGERKTFENVARAKGVPLEELRRGHPEELYWRVREQICRNQLTVEYREWEKRNKELHTKINKFLDEFYLDRESDIDIKLQTSENDGGSFEVSSERMPVV